MSFLMERFNILKEFKKNEKEREVYKNNYLIGTIEGFEYITEQDILTEERLASLKISGKGIGDVTVYDKEGMIPHCHIIFNDNDEHDCCICLLSSNYFKHPKKDNTLNSKQMKEFIKWCSATNLKYSTPNNIVNNWKAMCIVWNRNNPDSTQINLSIYNNIPNYKSDMGTIQDDKNAKDEIGKINKSKK